MGIHHQANRVLVPDHPEFEGEGQHFAKKKNRESTSPYPNQGEVQHSNHEECWIAVIQHPTSHPEVAKEPKDPDLNLGWVKQQNPSSRFEVVQHVKNYWGQKLLHPNVVVRNCSWSSQAKTQVVV